MIAAAVLLLGVGSATAQNGYLGQLSANPYAQNRIQPGTIQSPAHGRAPVLIDKQGNFRGTLGNQYDPNSVNNPYGKYGSPYSPDSINNPYSNAGSPYSQLSPTNPYGSGVNVYKPRF